MDKDANFYLDIYTRLGLKFVSNKHTAGTYLEVANCPFCGRQKKAWVKVTGPYIGFFKCFSGHCNTKGNVVGIYAQLKGVTKKQAELEIYGKKEIKDSITLKIESFDTNDLSYDVPNPVAFNPFFKKIETGDFAFNYLKDRGFCDDEILGDKLYKVSDSRCTLWAEIRCRLGPRQLEVMYFIRRFLNKKFISFDQLVEKLEGDKGDKGDRGDDEVNSGALIYDISDLQLAYHAIEAGKLLNRVIIPVEMGDQFYGYVGRSTIGELPKTRNSSGKFSSMIIGDFNKVKDSDTLIITEGKFDAMSIGEGACYLLGLGFNKNSYKAQLLKLLRPKTTFIFLDVGAGKIARDIYQILAIYHDRVFIVSPPPLIKKTDQNADIIRRLAELNLIKQVTDKDSLNLWNIPLKSLTRLESNSVYWVPFPIYIALKCFCRGRGGMTEFLRLVKNWEQDSYDKNQAIRYYQIITKDCKLRALTLKEGYSLAYLDSGDFTKEFNQILIQQAKKH